MKGHKKVQFPKRSKRKGHNHNQESSPAKLPPISFAMGWSTTLRFITTSNFTGAVGVTYQNLLDMVIIAGTSTTAYQLFDYVRVKRVTIRGLGGLPANSLYATGVSTVSVEYPGLVIGSGGSGRLASDSSMGQVPAMASLMPDPRSQAALWQPTSGNTCFVVRANDYAGGALIGAIIDVELSFKNNPDVNPATVASAVAGATSGEIYFGGIDGARLAATAARSTADRRI